MLLYDHAVILVEDLARAMDDFTVLGFNVVPGGQQADNSTANAIIVFNDNSYIELLDILGKSTQTLLGMMNRVGLLGLATVGRTPLTERFILHAAGDEGLVDFAINATAPETDLAALTELGFSKPETGQRVRMDGTLVTCEYSVPSSLHLPYVVVDQTEREDRMPALRDARKHVNGVEGTRGLVMAVNDIDAAAAQYTQLLGGTPQLNGYSVVGARRTVDINLHGFTLTLAGDPEPGSALALRMARRGPGTHLLRVYSPQGSGNFNTQLAHGALITAD